MKKTPVDAFYKHEAMPPPSFHYAKTVTKSYGVDLKNVKDYDLCDKCGGTGYYLEEKKRNSFVQRKCDHVNRDS